MVNGFIGLVLGIVIGGMGMYFYLNFIKKG